MKLFWWYGLLIAAGAAFVDSYVTLYALSMGATSLQIGTLSSLASFAAMVAPVPGALWAARWGKRKWVVVIAFGLRHLGLLGALLVPWFFSGQTAIVLIIGLMALRAGFANLGSPAWSSLAGDLVPMERRGRYFSARKTVMAVASLAFVPLAGQIIGWIGEPQGYQFSFLIAVLVSGVAMYCYALIPEKRTLASGKQSYDLRVFGKALFGRRTFLLFTLFSMIFNFAWQAAGPYFSVYQVKVLGATPAIVGMLSTVSALSRVFGQQFWGRFIDRRGSQWTVVICKLLVSILPLLWLPATRPWQLLWVVIPSGFLWAGHELSNFNLQLELSEAEYRTQAIAGYTTMLSIANMFGPLVGAAVIEQMGYKWIFALSGAGRFFGGILFLLLLNPFNLRSRIVSLRAGRRGRIHGVKAREKTEAEDISSKGA